MLKCAMAQNSMYTKNDCSEWLIFSNIMKYNLFWCVGDLFNHLRTEVMTKSVKKISEFNTYIELGTQCWNVPWLRTQYILNMIVVNDWFYLTVLNKIISISRGPVNSFQNRSCNQSREIMTYFLTFNLGPKGWNASQLTILCLKKIV